MYPKNTREYICISLLFVGCYACNSKELTRAKAKEAIEKTDLYKSTKRPLFIRNEEVNDLVNKRMLGWRHTLGGASQVLVVEPAGSKYFELAGGQMSSYVAFVQAPFWVKPAIELKPEIVEITGITAGENDSSKLVEYRWRWKVDAAPKELLDAIPSIKTVQAEKVALHLYDDGWRAMFPKQQ